MTDMTGGTMTNGGTAGGGQILQYFTGNEHEGTQYIDWQLVKQFVMLPFVKALIIILLLIIATMIILRLFNIKSLIKGKGIRNELGNRNMLRTRDAYILRSNKILSIITKIVEKTPFCVAKEDKEYLQYNINRAGIKVPGGYRSMTAEEFNAVVKMAGAILLFIGLFLLLFINMSVGVIFVSLTIGTVITLPNLVLRQIVMAKDAEIRRNFSDFYLMLHYVLVIGGSTPIDKIMKSYAKTTESEEMIRFVDNCVGHIDTHGEYNATTIIARDYREIAEVGKLMRLIKQMFDGADVAEELVGFRDELMKERRYEIEKQMNKLVAIANRCFNILMIILVQAILSAMAIYLPDMGLMSSMF
jgi:hypothetical protein